MNQSDHTGLIPGWNAFQTNLIVSQKHQKMVSTPAAGRAVEQDVDSCDRAKGATGKHTHWGRLLPLWVGCGDSCHCGQAPTKCTFRPWKGAGDHGKLTPGLWLDLLVFVLKLCIRCLWARPTNSFLNPAGGVCRPMPAVTRGAGPRYPKQLVQKNVEH